MLKTQKALPSGTPWPPGLRNYCTISNFQSIRQRVLCVTFFINSLTRRTAEWSVTTGQRLNVERFWLTENGQKNPVLRVLQGAKIRIAKGQRDSLLVHKSKWYSIQLILQNAVALAPNPRLRSL